MEKHCIKNPDATNVDVSTYNQCKAESSAGNITNQSERMRVLYSGQGKAQKDMGMAAIPPLWVPGPPACN